MRKCAVSLLRGQILANLEEEEEEGVEEEAVEEEVGGLEVTTIAAMMITLFISTQNEQVWCCWNLGF